MSYIILRGCWYYIIVLNVHAPTEDKIDDVKDGKTHNQIDHILIDRRWHSSMLGILIVRGSRL
jgi:hypothetical protein